MTSRNKKLYFVDWYLLDFLIDMAAPLATCMLLYYSNDFQSRAEHWCRYKLVFSFNCIIIGNRVGQELGVVVILVCLVCILQIEHDINEFLWPFGLIAKLLYVFPVTIKLDHGMLYSQIQSRTIHQVVLPTQRYCRVHKRLPNCFRIAKLHLRLESCLLYKFSCVVMTLEPQHSWWNIFHCRFGACAC
jgi:hypothetical protein